MKRTIRPQPMKQHLTALIDYIAARPQDAEIKLLIPHIDALLTGFIDPANLIKISSFANLYGKTYNASGKAVSKQAIYQMIDEGRLPEIIIDEVKFVDKNILDDETE